MSAARSLASLKKNIVGTIKYNDSTFTYVIYPNPHRKSLKEKEELIKYFGQRIQKGSPCLGITEKSVSDNIERHNYNALISVKNDNVDDSVTGALQYYDWCKNGDKQFWISDLCRVNNSGQSNTSPVHIFFNIIKEFSLKKHIHMNYLMVEKDQKGTEKLLEIYGAYGFHIDDTCIIDNMITMKKSLVNSGGVRRTNRINKTHKKSRKNSFNCI